MCLLVSGHSLGIVMFVFVFVFVFVWKFGFSCMLVASSWVISHIVAYVVKRIDEASRSDQTEGDIECSQGGWVTAGVDGGK